MAEPSEILVPAVAALGVIEARLSAGWTLLAVTGLRTRKGDATPDPALTLEFADGTTDPGDAAAVATWPADRDLVAQVRFAPL